MMHFSVSLQVVVAHGSELVTVSATHWALPACTGEGWPRAAVRVAGQPRMLQPDSQADLGWYVHGGEVQPPTSAHGCKGTRLRAAQPNPALLSTTLLFSAPPRSSPLTSTWQAVRWGQAMAAQSAPSPEGSLSFQSYVPSPATLSHAHEGAEGTQHG